MTVVLVLGDSIARGDGASQPARSFVRLWLATLTGPQRALYFCRGGATVLTGREWAPYVWCEPAPDYVLVAYGMNDQTRRPSRVARRRGVSVPVSKFGEALLELVGILTSRYPAAQVIVMSSARPHPAWEGDAGLSREYRDKAADVAGSTNVIFADGLTAWEDALRSGTDLNGLYENAANHPSDTGHAILADALIRAVPEPDGPTDTRTRS